VGEGRVRTPRFNPTLVTLPLGHMAIDKMNIYSRYFFFSKFSCGLYLLFVCGEIAYAARLFRAEI
jgi:hypothetical protein